MAEAGPPSKKSKPASWTPQERLKLVREYIHTLPWPAWPLGEFPDDASLDTVVERFMQSSPETRRERTGVVRRLRTELTERGSGFAPSAIDLRHVTAEELLQRRFLSAATVLKELTAEVCSSEPSRPEVEWSAGQDRSLLAAHIAELPASWEGAGLADTRIEAVLARFHAADCTHTADSVIRRLCTLLESDGESRSLALCSALLSAVPREAAGNAASTNAAGGAAPSEAVTTAPSDAAAAVFAASSEVAADAFAVECAGMEKGGASYVLLV
jgi:hypothetical protein